MENSVITSRPTSRTWLLALFGAIAMLVAFGGVVSKNGLAKAVPPAGSTQPVVAEGDAAVVVRQNRDRIAARTVCIAAVQHLLGSPLRNSQDVQNGFAVRSVSEGVMSVEVRVPLDDSSPGAPSTVYACQATNQTGEWDAESVTKQST